MNAWMKCAPNVPQFIQYCALRFCRFHWLFLRIWNTLFSSINGWVCVCVYVYESEHECVICSPCEYAIFGVLFQKSIYIYEKKSERHTTGKMIIVCFVVRCKWAVCGASRAGSVFGFSSHKRYYSLPIYMQRDRHTNTKKRAAEERNKQTHKQNMNWQRCNALQQWQWSVIDFLILCLRTGAGAYSHYC